MVFQGRIEAGEKLAIKPLTRLVLGKRISFSILLPLGVLLLFLIFSIQEQREIVTLAQLPNCQSLIYPCQEGLISFPLDEGKHADKKVEWWYVNFNVVNSPYSTSLAGAIALVRVNLAGEDQGFGLLEITNEDSSEFFYRVLSGKITSEVGNQNVDFIADPGSEITSVKFYQSGREFQYRLEVDGTEIDIDVLLTSQKRPLVEGGNGYVPIFASDPSEESGYYSLTDLSVSDSGIALPGAPWFSINGKAWIDHQWFNIPAGYDPLSLRGPHHEWFSVQLDNDVQIVAWEIFKETSSSDLELALKNLDVIDAAGSQIHYDDFTLDPILYWDSVDGRLAQAWHLRVEDKIDLTIQTSIEDQYVSPYETYEGSTNITGVYGESIVNGQGFAEMTLKYNPSCLPLKEICDGIDNDCDFRIDEFCAPAPGDVNGDGVIDKEDLRELLSVFRSTDSVADLDDDGVVNSLDFVKLLSLI